VEETITVRIPKDLKATFETACEARGITLTAGVRLALQDFVAPSTRVFELPGLSGAFQDFLRSDELRGRKGRALLLVIDEGGHRAVYYGTIDFNLVEGGVVGIRTKGAQPWILLKKNVVGWFSADHDFSEMIEALHQRGWHPVTYAPR
jgi:hypothetical protein